VQETKIDIRCLTTPQLVDYFKQKGLPSFRAKQVSHWLWQKNASTFDEMTTLSKELREQLDKEFDILPIVTDKVQYSNDGTIKSRFRLHDGHLIEAVLIPVPEDKRFTVCVSTQVGCSLSCSFCATGLMKRHRNLTAGEIVDQYRLVNEQCLKTFDHPLTNVVYMGMGEPLLNYANTLQSIYYLTSEEGLNISPRRITVSTAGIAKMIRKLADDEVKFNLALSLHAADDTKRNEIMPINNTNNLEVLMEALRYFYRNTRGRISYGYIAFDKFNDSREDALKLVKLCKDFPVRVNIIEYNPVEGLDFVKTGKDRLDEFAQVLTRNDVVTTVRRSRGKDIDAACGQLANKDQDL
jgi:23S rRNA (adenine2503-C2)-methyltransferase